MSTATLYAQLDALADDWLASSSRASATQRAYRVEVSRMLTWAGSQRHISLTNLPDDYLCQFLECIASQQPACYLSAGIRKQLRPSSVLQSKRILTAMFLWGAEQDRVPIAISLNARRWKLGIADVTPENGALRSRVPAPKPAPQPGEAALRRDFVRGLAYWLGARPADISALRRTDLRIRDDVLEVVLPDGSGRPMKSYGPPELAQTWRKLRYICQESLFAVLRVGSTEALSVSAIARLLAPTTSTEPSNARALRRAGAQHLQELGWSESDIRNQYRRKALSFNEQAIPMVAIQRRMRNLNSTK